jgi:hypothetical protein
MNKKLWLFFITLIFILNDSTLKVKANEIILKNCYQVKLDYPGGIMHLFLEKKQLNKELEKKSMQIQDLKRYDDIIRNLGLSEEKLKNLRDSKYDDKKFKYSLYKDYSFTFDFRNITVKRITSYKDEVFENKNKEFFGTLSKEEAIIFKFKELFNPEIENTYTFYDSIIHGNQYEFHVNLEYNIISSSKMGTFLCNKN